MIVNEQFSIEKDDVGWKVIENSLGINPKTNKQCISTKNTYHATLLQCCKYVNDRGVNDQDIGTIIKSIIDSTNACIKAIKSIGEK